MKYQSITQPHFKPVYVFGAGASYMIGGPLLDNFLGVARALRYSPDFKTILPDILIPKLEESFRRVFEYQDRLFRAREFLGIDVSNLETMFSILDMEWQTDLMKLAPPSFLVTGHTDQELHQVRESLFALIVATLKFWVSDQNTGYNGLINRLASAKDAVFITFNYDLAIEKALNPAYVPYYGFEPEDPNEIPVNQRSILKLHGSANWTYCPDCEQITVHDDYFSPLELPANNLPSHHRSQCKKKDTSLNLLLPPTWYKYNYLDAITRIWRRSIRELSTATHVVIIGYSFPRTDVFFDQMLTLGLRDSKNLEQVAIINPSPSIESIVNSVFDKHFRRRSVVFYKTGIQNLADTGSKPIDMLGKFRNMLSYLDKYKVG